MAGWRTGAARLATLPGHGRPVGVGGARGMSPCRAAKTAAALRVRAPILS
jgi:hypothetical protein